MGLAMVVVMVVGVMAVAFSYLRNEVPYVQTACTALSNNMKLPCTTISISPLVGLLRRLSLQAAFSNWNSNESHCRGQRFQVRQKD